MNPRLRALLCVLCLALGVAACGPAGSDASYSTGWGVSIREPILLPSASSVPSSPDLSSDPSVAAAEHPVVLSQGPLGGSRPATLHVPASYTPGRPVPLVLLLHGYGASGAVEEAYMHLTPQSDSFGFLYAYPDGTKDVAGNRFWNATDACCNFFDAPVDDSAYLSGLIDEIERRYSVARDQVFIIGHSNGAFMAYRMACDHAGQVSGIVSLAGAMWEDPASCAASAPVSVLEIHGTDDPLVPFSGGYIQDRAVPSAAQSVHDWVTHNGCVDSPDTSAPNLDLDADIAGAETTLTKYESCTSGKDAQLWTIEGGDHIPSLTDEFAFDIVSHLLGTPRSVFTN